MIPIKRPTAKSLKIPVFTDVKKSGFTSSEEEQILAIEHYIKTANLRTDKTILENAKKVKKLSRKNNFKQFKVYKDKKLARALVEVFNGKCAYCESRFAHVSPADIEHFRPKSSIDQGVDDLKLTRGPKVTKENKKIKPGYYWLAADWDNLLLSCIDCNRRRLHLTGSSSKIMSLGKQDRFPVKSLSKRITSHKQDIKKEKTYRLLINPCEDNPDKYLEFDKDGMVKAKGRSNMGKASIIIYGLSRKNLVDERKVESLLLQNDFTVLIQTIERLLSIQKIGPDLAKLESKIKGNTTLEKILDNVKNEVSKSEASIIEHFKKVKDFIKAKFDPKEPYILMKRQVVANEIANWPKMKTFVNAKLVDLDDLVKP